ncbi:MAG: DUF1707 SHOCT-like domain-containing protein [Trebonia sp.]
MIAVLPMPVLPMPVLPYPAWDLGHKADLRASDADRDVAADMLCAAVADGRLTLAELDVRLEDVLSARTIRELARLISDLSCPGIPKAARSSAVRPRPPAESRWSLLQSLLAESQPDGQSGL